MNKLLIDTNVLIYALDKNSTFNNVATQILQTDSSIIYITAKNVSEYFAVCTKLQIEQEVIWGFYEDLKRNATILFPDESSLFSFENLLKKYKPKGNRIFDVEIVSVMLANNISHIATFNIDDFKNITEINIVQTVL